MPEYIVESERRGRRRGHEPRLGTYQLPNSRDQVIMDRALMESRTKADEVAQVQNFRNTWDPTMSWSMSHPGVHNNPNHVYPSQYRINRHFQKATPAQLGRFPLPPESCLPPGLSEHLRYNGPIRQPPYGIGPYGVSPNMYPGPSLWPTRDGRFDERYDDRRHNLGRHPYDSDPNYNPLYGYPYENPTRHAGRRTSNNDISPFGDPRISTYVPAHDDDDDDNGGHSTSSRHSHASYHTDPSWNRSGKGRHKRGPFDSRSEADADEDD